MPAVEKRGPIIGPTDADVNALPERLRDTVLDAYAIIGVEPTSIRTDGGGHPSVYFGGLMSITYNMTDGALSMRLPGLVGLVTDDHLRPDSQTLAVVAQAINGIKPPPEQVVEDRDWWQRSMAEAVVRHTLVRCWDLACLEIANWRRGAKPEQQSTIDAYERFVLDHEVACRAAGLTTPLQMGLSWSNTAGYDVGSGGYVEEWSLNLRMRLDGTGVLALSVNADDNDNFNSDGLCSKRDAICLLAGKVRELEAELATAKAMLALADSPGVTYVYDLPESDEEDEEEDDDDDQ